MAMLLLSAQSQCAKCFGELERRNEGKIQICFACDQEYSVETLTALHRKPSVNQST
ncbi:hypothetical protein AYL99_05422 [Fonsecaea erecta]|uniref:Uncharacterized protein n=1 Tax=Fonsecaea erecta TaxID=1367422 RepID=A0A178ZKU6_9EURO|nr:hypothetical protein AYL99_05422 [Fonsecaea erecta]OAP60420.1 hypothetical protein AYL99_05422 [Fonsecaea erecta]